MNRNDGAAAEFGVVAQNGLEAWRQLVEWYQPRSGSRGLGLLTEVLQWDFGTSKDAYGQKLKDWENATMEYNRVAAEPVPDSILLAVLISRAPRTSRCTCRRR